MTTMMNEPMLCFLLNHIKAIIKITCEFSEKAEGPMGPSQSGGLPRGAMGKFHKTVSQNKSYTPWREGPDGRQICPLH